MWRASHPGADPPGRPVRFVDLWDPLARVDGVEGASVRLGVTGETRAHAGRPLLNWTVPLALGVTAFVRVRRRRNA